MCTTLMGDMSAVFQVDVVEVNLAQGQQTKDRSRSIEVQR